MANRREINQAVGQPDMVPHPLGRGVIPERTPHTSSHTGRLGIAAIALAAAGGAGYLALRGGGTGPGPIETQGAITPSSMPSQEPSIIVPSATPGQSVEVTFPPTQKPEVTPEPIALKDFVEKLEAEAKKNGGKWKNVSASKVASSVQEAYRADPEAANTVFQALKGTDYEGKPASEAVDGYWKSCLKETDGNLKAIDCAQSIGVEYNLYAINHNEKHLTAIENKLSYVHHALGEQGTGYVMKALKKFPIFH